MATQSDVGGTPGILRSVRYNDLGSDNHSMDADIHSDSDRLILLHDEVLFEDRSECQTSRRRK